MQTLDERWNLLFHVVKTTPDKPLWNRDKIGLRAWAISAWKAQLGRTYENVRR